MIVLTSDALSQADLCRLTEAYFRDMVKVVVDVRRGRAAVGGELQADAEQLLLEEGSEQADLWGPTTTPGVEALDHLPATGDLCRHPREERQRAERLAARRVAVGLVGTMPHVRPIGRLLQPHAATLEPHGVSREGGTNGVLEGTLRRRSGGDTEGARRLRWTPEEHSVA